MIAGASAAAALAGLPAAAGLVASAAGPANVDVSQRHLNESEEAIAVNPASPGNIVTVTNVGHAEAGLTAGMFEGISFDGGKTWTTKLIALGAGDPLAMAAATRACPSTATGTCSRSGGVRPSMNSCTTQASPPGMSRTPGFIATPDGKIAGGWPAENK